MEGVKSTCEPFPSCSTFVVPSCTNDIFNGCQRVGGYLILLILYNIQKEQYPPGIYLNPVTSGRINSQGKFSFRYGRLEIRAKLPRGDWLWPALWLLPEDSIYGGWPASGEIDVMESRGNDKSYLKNGVPSGNNAVSSTLHYGIISNIKDKTGKDYFYIADGWPNVFVNKVMKDGDFTQEFHTFGFYWDEEMMYTYILDELNGTEDVILDLRSGYKNGFWEPPLGNSGEIGWDKCPYTSSKNINAPFDQEFFIVMNVAVGGQGGALGYWVNAPWAGCTFPSCATTTRFWESRDDWFPTWQNAGDDISMIIDSVKVWK